MPSLHDKDRFSPKEAAAVIGCGIKFLRDEIRLGRIYPVTQINRRVIWITRSAIEEYQRIRTATSRKCSQLTPT